MARPGYTYYDNDNANERAWGGVEGSSEEDAKRYQGLGARRNQAIQVDQGQADQSRGLQMGALGLLRHASYGNAPSQAAAQGQLASQDALRQGVAASGGGTLFGMRGAMGQTAGRMTVANSASMNARSSEAMRDMGAFSGAASQVRGQDLQAATTNAQLEAQQRAADEQQQQYYERMAWDTRNADMNAAIEQKRQDAENELRQRQNAEANRAKDWNIAKGITSAVSGVLMAPFKAISDERAKTNILPMGSLAHLFPR